MNYSSYEQYIKLIVLSSLNLDHIHHNCSIIRMTLNFQWLFLFIIVSQIEGSHTSNPNNIFLTPNQNWLLFPHRHFQTISTFTANCSILTTTNTIPHEQLTTVSNIFLNNSNIDLAVSVEREQLAPIFRYAKISFDGICTVYEVEKQQTKVLYEYTVGMTFTNLLIINKFDIILWNTKELLRLQYSPTTKQVKTSNLNFSTQNERKCQYFHESAILCWNQQQIHFIQLNDTLIANHKIAYEGQKIKIILPLQSNQKVIFLCSEVICSFGIIEKDWTLHFTTIFPFVVPIMGGDFNPQTSTILTVHPDNAILFTYIPGQERQLRQQQALSYPPGYSCIYFDHTRLLQEQLIIECLDFMGSEEDIILMKDKQRNAYYSYQPFMPEQNNSCILEGNANYIFRVCELSITIKMNNFYFVQIFNTTQDHTVNVVCIDHVPQIGEQTQTFQLNVFKAEYNHKYINQLIKPNETMNYDVNFAIKLKNAFKTSDIVYYSIESNCPFIKNNRYEPIDYLYYFSIYNREKCVQIVSGGNRMFYRILQINETTFYLQECYLINLGYGCELILILDNLLSLRMVTVGEFLIKIYIKGGYLVMDYDNKTRVIYNETITSYQLKNQILEIKAGNRTLFNSLKNIIYNCGKWIEELDNSQYFLQQNSVLEINQAGLIQQYQNNSIVDKTSIGLVRNHQFKKTDTSQKHVLPFVGKRRYNIFVINQTHITKLFAHEPIIIIYELPYNPAMSSIQKISMVDTYIVIQYTIGYFEIYSTQEQAVSALITTIQENILSEIIIMDNDVLLIPIKSQTYMVKIQTDPLLLIGSLLPNYSLFREVCKVFITPITNNGSCPTTNNYCSSVTQPLSINQSIQLTIIFNIQLIDLDNHIQLQPQPYQCQNCVLEIKQQNFYGPIFTYQLNDDYFGTFVLTPHLSILECQNQQLILYNITKINYSDEIARNQTMLMNSDTIFILNSNLQIKIQFKINSSLCSSYLTINQFYFIFCQNHFLLYNNNQKIEYRSHTLPINTTNRQQFQLDSQQINNSTHIIYILDPQNMMHIYLLMTNNLTINHLNNYQFHSQIFDFQVDNRNIVILEGKSLCTAESYLLRQVCFPLDQFIPKYYSSDYQYTDLSIYQSNDNQLRVLIFSKNSDNLHIDLLITKQNGTFLYFTVLNAYSGFVGYKLNTIISINTLNNSYSNFILLYQEQTNENSDYLVTYYQYNFQYSYNCTIGQIRSAELLNNFFSNTYNYTFIPFPHHLYITCSTSNISQGTINKKNRKCLSISIFDKLTVTLNYNAPPQLKFLILRARNVNQIQSHYIKIVYQNQSNLLIGSLIGLLSLTIMLFLLIIVTNRCKEVITEIEVTLLDQQFGPDDLSNDYSSLLHSKSQPSEPRSHQFSFDDDQ